MMENADDRFVFGPVLAGNRVPATMFLFPQPVPNRLQTTRVACLFSFGILGQLTGTLVD